jgi:hypothetical protein
MFPIREGKLEPPRALVQFDFGGHGHDGKEA